ncbi:hypothetical protein ACFCV8_07360 [Streptomyces sp. NPDC056347]|uniref:hypothetical protein n=1 Tax=Streptomyces sp. NPDC056347 TaxID=3345790 RepID=UPI0035DF7643
MARYQITHSCGHEATVQLSGSRRDREWRAGKEEERPCRECWQKERDREREEERRAAVEAAGREGLPELEGSPKQVAWAETIRRDLISRLEEFVDGLQRYRVPRDGEAAPDGDGPVSERSARRAAARAAKAAEAAGAEEAGRTALAALREVSTARWFIDNQTTVAARLVSLARRGEFVPRTPEQEAAGFDPNGNNTLRLPRGEVRIEQDGDAVVTLRGSRWEGCFFTHPASLTTVHTGTAGTEQADDDEAGPVELKFHGGWTFAVSDGRRVRRVAAQEMHADRTAGRREGPGPRHYLLPAPWRPEAWNEIDVPEGDIAEAIDAFGDRMPGHVRVMLRCSRWEGLYLHHRRRLVVQHRPGYVTLLVPSDTPQLRLHGGAGRTTVPAAELAEDRARPLQGPGDSLAVPQERWHRVVFHSSRVRQVKDASMVRFGWETQDPKAVVFHRGTMCRALKGGAVEWRFPDRWEFQLRLPQGGTRTLSAAEFVEVTADWARTEPVPGTHQRVPDLLDPAVPEIDPELLDDGLDIPEEWDTDDDGQDPGDDHPDNAGVAGHGANERERNADR